LIKLRYSDPNINGRITFRPNGTARIYIQCPDKPEYARVFCRALGEMLDYTGPEATKKREPNPTVAEAHYENAAL